MRLHRLDVTAFGPFAGSVAVDFDAVGVNGLFLVHGPTGAGKTSLLDAVCFALYAGVPGARPGGRALRSDHAGRDAVPTVRLDFGVGTRRLRVTRSPEFLRPKRRGAGVTRAPASVVLEEHAGGRWRGVTTRADEAGDIITDALGMGLDQFSKVVLLPQGEFAAFLRATADERRTLLEKLFDISAYAGAENWLAERRRVLAGRCADEQALLATDLARLGDVLGAVPPDVLAGMPAVMPGAAPADLLADTYRTGLGDAPNPAQTLRATLADLHTRLEQHALACLAASAEADDEATAAQDAAVCAARVADLQRRGRVAKQVVTAFEADSEHWRSLRDTVDRAARADAVSGDLRSLSRARERLAAAEARVDGARRALPVLGDSEWTQPAAEGMVAALQEHGSALDEARAVCRRLDEDRARLARLATSRDHHRHSLEQARGALAAAHGAVQSAALDVEALHAATRTRDAAEAHAVRCARAHAVSVELDRVEVEVEQARAAVVEAREHEQDAREELQSRQQARLDGMAAELAAQLADGAPCAVCGSVEHPAPASPGAAVSPADVAAAEQRWQALREATGRHATTLAGLERLVETRRADVADAVAALVPPAGTAPTRTSRKADQVSPGTPELARRLRHAHTASGKATAEVDRLGEAHGRLAAAGRQVESLGPEVEREARALAALEGTVAEVRERLDLQVAEMARVVDEHRRACPCGAASPVGAASDDMGTTARTHEVVSSGVEELRDALLAEQECVQDLQTVAAEAENALRANGFHNVDDALEAALVPDDLTQVQRQLRDLEDRRVAAAATLADPDVAAALSEREADAEAAARAAEATRARVRQAQHAQSQAEATLRVLGQVKASICGRLETLAPLAVESARVGELADTATGVGGHNVLRMRLTAFVLAARLEKVATLANERLLVMGEGRYQLAHSDDLAPGGRRSGLGLVVQDQWTGQVRETSSLSGGESFMASLALALGLADAVREEAGGFDLNTLFIDEGFGTLDDESLEQVMSVLDGLRDGGRCVGVVSHVSDLRLRIPAQVRVDKTATGSGVTVLGVKSPAA